MNNQKNQRKHGVRHGRNHHGKPHAKRKPPEFGSPEYIVAKFDEIHSVRDATPNDTKGGFTKLSNSDYVKAVKFMVATGDDGDGGTAEMAIAHVALEDANDQLAYAVALQKILATRKYAILDMKIGLTYNKWDLIIACVPGTDKR